MVLEAVERVRADMVRCAGAATWSLSDAEAVESLVALHRLRQTVDAMMLHLVREVDGRGLATARHFRHTAAWLRSLLTVDAAVARGLVEQAADLDRHPAVDAALTSGDLDVRQAAAITGALDRLPDGDDGVPPDVRREAEAKLIDLAGEFGAAPLRRLGGRILEHVAPDVAERLAAAMLRREEERARQKRGIMLSTPFEGRVFVRGYLTVEDAAVVSAALDPLCAPIAGDQRTPAQRRADALVDVCRLALRTADLPDHGGEPPQLAVTIAFDPLTRSVSTARLDSGERLTPEAARRIACDAQVLPFVLGGAGQVLDAGRSRRLASGALRRALVARDRGCAFPGCDRPARWCDAHHVIPWVEGGATRLDNLVLVCALHHRLLHEQEWTARIGADDLPEFLPPTVQDESRRPRRNRYHPRT